MSKRIWPPALAAALVFLAGGCVVFFQGRLIYHPRRYTDGERSAREAGRWEELRFKTNEGEQRAYYLPAAESPDAAPIWALFGGNAFLALDWLDFCQAARRASPRRAFLLIEYPGYGENPGSASPAALRETAAGALAALAARHSTTPAALAPRLHALGHSLGAAAALIFAKEAGPRSVILVAPFTSMYDMARRLVGRPLAWLLTHRYDNRARLAELSARSPKPAVALFHGARDELIPAEMGRELAAAHPGWVEYTEVPGADHNGILYSARAALLATMARQEE